MKNQNHLRSGPLLMAALALLSLILYSSCKKSGIDRDTISGHVYEFGTNNPIAGALVRIYGWEGDLLSGGTSYKVADVLTDQDGYYHLKDTGQFALAMTANAYKDFYFTDYDSERSVADGDYDMTDIHLKPYAWLKVKVKNESGRYYSFRTNLEDNSVTTEFVLSVGDSTEYSKLTYGNIPLPFQFSIKNPLNGLPVTSAEGIIFLVNGNQLQIDSLGSGYSPQITATGHDTTKISIIY